MSKTNARTSTKVVEVRGVSISDAHNKQSLEHRKTSISAQVRYLDSLGIFTRGQMAKLIDRRYQQVRNILVVPVTNPKK